MAKKRCNVDEIKIDEVLAEDIFNDNGVLVIPKGTRVSEYIINRCHELDISTLWILEPDNIFEIALSPKDQQLIVDYNKGVGEIKDVINDLATGKKLDYKKIDDVSHNLLHQETSNFGVIECVRRLKSSDEYTYNHMVNVSLYAMLLANWLEFSDDQVKDVMNAGLLHDIGKSMIPDSILYKKGALSNEEFEVIKKHTLLGYNIVKEMESVSDEVKQVVLMHHEREDGSGYPLGIDGNRIGIYSKIIAIADTYDALTSEKVYRKRKTPFGAFKEMANIAGGVFDMKILMIFLSNLANYYVGARVMLNNGDIGEVVFVPNANISDPVIRVGEKYIDLLKQKNLEIVEML